MPATQIAPNHHRISCSLCGVSVETIGPLSSLSETLGLASVDSYFRWQRSANRFYSQCRSCEAEQRRTYPERRARRAAARAAGSATVSRSTRTLGLNRRFGVEFEIVVPDDISRSQINGALPAGWRVKSDSSIRGGRGQYGLEVVSPALSGESGIEEIQNVTRILRGFGADVNRTCGTHVHHDINDLDIDQIKRVYNGWVANRSILDGLVAPSRRAGANTYCGAIRPADVATVNAARDLAALRGTSVSRYRSLNIMSYGRYGTIEVRQHQGTLSAEKIRSWILLGQAIIDTAIVGELSGATTVRGFVAMLAERLDETARTFVLGRAVEFGVAAI